MQIDKLKCRLGDGDEMIRRAKRDIEDKDDMIDHLRRRQRALKADEYKMSLNQQHKGDI